MHYYLLNLLICDLILAVGMLYKYAYWLICTILLGGLLNIEWMVKAVSLKVVSLSAVISNVPECIPRCSLHHSR